jgi:hypothetical protein
LIPARKDNAVNAVIVNANVTNESTAAAVTKQEDLAEMDIDTTDMDVAHACPANGPWSTAASCLPMMNDDHADGAEPYTTETWICLTAIWDTYQGAAL